MPIINQPFQGQLGEILKEKLTDSYSEFIIFSAFAKNSGVLRLKPSIEDFRSRGGIVNAFIGIDLDGTSYESLLNLYHMCDNLYIIHSENPTSTYHSKIYLLKNNDFAWCAIGSNNLTGGGLWTNFESCSIQNFDLDSPCEEINNINSLIEQYTNPEYQCSARINAIEDIDNLFSSNYITKEASQRVNKVSKEKSTKKRRQKTNFFGAEKVTIPKIISTHQKSNANADNNSPKPTDYIIYPEADSPAFENEQFWFESRATTGESRNILDLSKLGRIMSGSVKGTTYEYTANAAMMYGGIKFFEIDPYDITREKDITINYLGKDYFPATIKYNPSNSNWRIQLKGEPTDGTDALSKYGNRGDFKHKILVFEKINDSYYVLSLLEESTLPSLQKISRVWAYNGRTKNARAFGMF